MKVQNFIEEFKEKKITNSKVNPTAIEDYIKKTLEVKEYIPFAEKQAVINIVLSSCTQIIDGAISIDSVEKYILFTCAMLNTYTNLEMDENISSYDMLCENMIEEETMLDAILHTFDKEYGRCLNILNMVTADLLAENNIEKQIGKFLNEILKNVDGIMENIISIFNFIPDNLSQLDIDKLTKLISQIKK